MHLQPLNVLSKSRFSAIRMRNIVVPGRNWHQDTLRQHVKLAEIQLTDGHKGYAPVRGQDTFALAVNRQGRLVMTREGQSLPYGFLLAPELIMTSPIAVPVETEVTFKQLQALLCALKPKTTLSEALGSFLQQAQDAPNAFVAVKTLQDIAASENLPKLAEVIAMFGYLSTGHIQLRNVPGLLALATVPGIEPWLEAQNNRTPGLADFNALPNLLTFLDTHFLERNTVEDASLAAPKQPTWWANMLSRLTFKPA